MSIPARYRVARLLTNPSVVIALITTVFGSLAVALAANSVTRSLGERELQFKVVDALIQYTKQDDMANVPAISKLDALTRLIRDNEQFSVRVDGFLDILKDLRNDVLKKKEEEISAIRSQLKDKTLEAGGRVELEGMLAGKQQELVLLKNRENELNKSSSEREQALLRAKDELNKSKSVTSMMEQRISRLTQQNSDLTSAKSGDCLEQTHRIKVKVDSDNSADTLLSLWFLDSEPDSAWSSHTGFHEFTVPGRPSGTLERTVCSDIFLKRRFFALVNSSSNGWTGRITVFFDGAERFLVEVPRNSKIQQETRHIELDELLQRKSAVLRGT